MRQIILGLGNLLNRDEGLGVHAVRALAADPPARLECVDGGVLGLGLLPLVESCSHLLILDAIDAGRPPGALIELPRERIPLHAGVDLSPHQLSFVDVLALAAARDGLPAHLHLLGLQPADLSWGTDLHPHTAANLPRLLQRARAIVQAWQ